MAVRNTLCRALAISAARTDCSPVLRAELILLSTTLVKPGMALHQFLIVAVNVALSGFFDLLIVHQKNPPTVM